MYFFIYFIVTHPIVVIMSIKQNLDLNLMFIGPYIILVGFGGLGVACWPLVPKFAGSNPAEAVGFLG